MYKIVWLLPDGTIYDVGSPMFAPDIHPAKAGDYVARWIWPQMSRNHPTIRGYILLQVPTGEEMFRWTRDIRPP